jgi:hypothetical protein
MATSFKYLTENDRVVSSTPLETVVSKTKTADYNTKNVGTGVNSLFYIYGTGSVNTLGVSYGSGSSAGTGDVYDAAAARTYKQFAHTLLGYDSANQLKTFSGSLTSSLQENLVFLTLPRSLINDKIKEGTFSLSASGKLLTESGSLLEVQTGTAKYLASGGAVSGAVFYEAGIVVLNSSSIGSIGGASSMLEAAGYTTASVTAFGFNAVTELNSTIYFCRAYNNEFNYSSNPTYLDNSAIRVKEGDPMNEPASYITTVGLYDENEQLLAVAKLSEPIKKTASNELIVRMRLDF